MLSRYNLAADGRTPVVVESLDDWVFAVESTKDPHVENGDTTIFDVRVSTVFLFLNHNWGDGPPLLWETMVFGGELDGEQERYSSYDAAVAGHAAMCERVRLTQRKRGIALGGLR